jgi:predicted PurR-regulated permease PerM
VKEIGADFGEPPIAPSTPKAGGPPAEVAAVPVQIISPPATGLRYLGQMLTPLLKPLGTAGMVLIFTIFILVKQEDLRDRFLRLAGVAQLHAMTLALDDAAQRISRYLLMQVVVNLCYGLCFGIGVFLIGIPNALLWGVFAGLFRLVP